MRPDQRARSCCSGERTPTWSPDQSIALGISTIYQDVDLIDTLTVADNIYLGRRDPRPARAVVDRKEQQRRPASCWTAEHPHPDRALVRDLSPAQKQMLQLAKALHREAKVIIMDEPTSSLGHEETQALMDLVRQRDRGGAVGIIYISHFLEEVFADRGPDDGAEGRGSGRHLTRRVRSTRRRSSWKWWAGRPACSTKGDACRDRARRCWSPGLHPAGAVRGRQLRRCGGGRSSASAGSWDPAERSWPTCCSASTSADAGELLSGREGHHPALPARGDRSGHRHDRREPQEDRPFLTCAREGEHRHRVDTSTAARSSAREEGGAWCAA